MLGAFWMSFWDGMTKNWADIEANARDPELRPILLPLAPAEAIAKVQAILGQLPRWSVASMDRDAGTLHAVHKTRVWGFRDDVRLGFRATDSGTEITGHSQSRIGKADLGQNARNLRELSTALQKSDQPGGQLR